MFKGSASSSLLAQPGSASSSLLAQQGSASSSLQQTSLAHQGNARRDAFAALRDGVATAASLGIKSGAARKRRRILLHDADVIHNVEDLTDHGMKRNSFSV